ncbi:alpha/beta-hydrolase [Mollisia scopiformis]|uniref:Alpha/beta-hydrolase n=1 Tax=Mollisia scopiformis TaxID=149040 RepID=A0A194XH78_MOLSC|nr:alpha/beta-hydrolase [Mollisia scopiformis]KUJ19127.1 alpha/beta-hydrolase [Mollisia scopiformis]
MAPQPYKISVPQEKIDNLKLKLSQAEFPDELSESAWELGVPLSDMKRLVKAWQQWDWRQAEEKINKLPQFHTPINVDGFGELDIHFVWQKSEVKNAIPLLFCHGWPGSFIEVQHILPLLAQPNGPAFHIVAPSLPNFGFSQGPSKRGFASAQYAETCHKLMLSLGYPEYVTQGGDWGFTVTRAMGKLYPQSCKASHINMILAFAPTWSKNPLLALQHALTPYSEKDKKGFERSEWFAREGRGYNLEQSTKPQTLAYALNDSPVALLAWIYEKLHDWTDSYPWSDDEIFTWVSIYAYSRMGPGAAHRIYYEVTHTQPGPGRVTQADIAGWIGGVKLGMAFNPKELGVFPKTWCRTLGPVVYESDNESGGHFFATERPELLARDLRTMFGRKGGAFGAVKGKSGFDDGKARL